MTDQTDTSAGAVERLEEYCCEAERRVARGSGYDLLHEMNGPHQRLYVSDLLAILAAKEKAGAERDEWKSKHEGMQSVLDRRREMQNENVLRGTEAVRARIAGMMPLEAVSIADLEEAYTDQKARAEAAEAEAAALREGLVDLRKSAALLQQNAEGCAVNHYGEDYEIHGFPGWLVDTRASIDRATLATLDQPKEGEQNDG